MTTETAPARAPRTLPWRIVMMVCLPAVLLAAGGVWWMSSGRYESTENANLHEARLSIASDLSGRVVQVGIHDSQRVAKGDLLFKVDPEPYRLALDEADVRLQASRLEVEQMKAALAQAEAQAKLARDDAAYLESELKRQEALSDRGVATGSALDEARHQARRAREQAEAADQVVAAALAALGGDPAAPTADHPKVRAAQVARDRAAYNLGLTEVRAPADGIVYQASSFREGQFVTAGAALFALVETGEVWVEANFKETQLDGIAVGQPVEIAFDLAPNRSFKGTVEAIGAGTGAEFSLLPAQNATGNWVKVSQRVPVRIKLDDPAQAAGLASGLSAEVTVDTGRHSNLLGLFAWAGE